MVELFVKQWTNGKLETKVPMRGINSPTSKSQLFKNPMEGN